MAQWPIPPDLHTVIEGGPICFFADHSIGSMDGRIPRYNDSHACVRCIAALTEGRLVLDVHKIHKKHRRRFLEFWSYVELDDPDECWTWHGPRHSRTGSSYFPFPRHWLDGRQFSAPRIACWFSWGDIGRLPLRCICGDNNCCNPLHIRVKGVPHFYHNRKMRLMDLEFSAHKLEHETHDFLLATRQRDPQRFRTLERHNKTWLDFRIAADGPVDPDTVAAAIAAEADELEQ
jgi:hypothetical protein